MPLVVGASRGTIALPPVKAGLLAYFPLRKDSEGISMAGGKHWESPTTETVSALGSYCQRKTGLVTDSALNTLRCERLGALLEAQRENLAIRSEEFDNAAWVRNNITLAANDTTAPDGNNTADRVDDNGADSNLTQAIAGGVLANNLQYTFSVYVEEDDATDFTLRIYDNGAPGDRARGDFEWSGGALQVKAEDFGTAGVEPIVAGWYRAWVTCATGVIVGANAHSLIIYPTEDGGGAVGLGHWFWGAQLEEAAGPASAPFPSSYIPTVAAAVTRTIDQLAYTNVGDVHCEPADGTIILAVTPEAGGAVYPADAYLYDITDGNDGVSLLISQANDTFQFNVDSGGGAVAAVQAPPGACRRGVTHVLATSWAANSFKLWMNGILVNQDTAGNAPTAMPDDIQVGSLAGASQGYVNIAYMIIYDRVLTELEIRRVTEWIQQQLGVPDLPPVVEGLNLYVPMDQDETAMSFWKGYRETSEPTTQTVDVDGTHDQRTTSLVTPAILNKLRVERPGGLLEGTRQNLLQRSEEIDQAPWANYNTPVVTPNTDVAPDGTLTADTIEDDNATSDGRYQIVAVADDAVTRVVSVYVKKTAGVTTFPVVRFLYTGGAPTVSKYAVLNTNTGIFTAVAGSVADNQGVEDAGDYWRVWMAQANNALGNTNLVVYLFPAYSSNGTTLDAAAVGSKVFWGAQVEQAEFPSSYIPTVAAAVTRSLDRLFYDNTNDVHAEPAAGTVICAVTPEYDPNEMDFTAAYIIDTRDVGANDGVALFVSDAPSAFHLYVKSGGGWSANLISTTPASRNQPFVLAGNWALNDFDLYVNGILEDSDGAGAAPTAQLDIAVGENTAGANAAFANIAHICIYNRVLTQPEILAVTKWILEKLPAGRLPPITNGLTLMAPMTPGEDARSFVGGEHTEAPSTETVDGDGAFVDPTNYDDVAGLSWVTDATVNELRRELLGGLIEPTTINYCLRSQEIDQPPWADENTPVVTPNTDVAPDGTTTADTIEDNDAGSHEGRRQDFVVPNDAIDRVFSVYVKKTTGATTFPGIRMLYTGGAPPLAGAITINTNMGAIANRTDVAEPPDDSAIEDAGDYWRVWIALANNASGNTTLRVFLFPAVNATGGGAWAVATVGSAVFWGAQYEHFIAFASAYIPTTNASVTKSGDVLEYDNAGEMHMERTDGTVIASVTAEYERPELPSWNTICRSRDAVSQNWIELYVNVGRFAMYVESGNVAQANITGTSDIRRSVPAVPCITWAVNDFRLYVNAILENSDGAGAIPLALGNTVDVGEGSYTNIAFLCIFTRVLDADEIDLCSHWIRRRLQAWI